MKAIEPLNSPMFYKLQTITPLRRALPSAAPARPAAGNRNKMRISSVLLCNRGEFAPTIYTAAMTND